MSGYLPFGGAFVGGGAGAVSLLIKIDDSALDDDSEYYEAFVKTRAYTPANLSQLASTPMQPIVSARSLAAVQLSLYLDRDFGTEVSDIARVLLTPDGAEVAVMPTFESATIADVSALQLQIGDEYIQQGAWSLEQLLVPMSPDGDR